MRSAHSPQLAHNHPQTAPHHAPTRAAPRHPRSSKSVFRRPSFRSVTSSHRMGRAFSRRGNVLWGWGNRADSLRRSKSARQNTNAPIFRLSDLSKSRTLHFQGVPRDGPGTRACWRSLALDRKRAFGAKIAKFLTVILYDFMICRSRFHAGPHQSRGPST